MIEEQLPRFVTCKTCGNVIIRERPCWFCPKPKQQRVAGKIMPIGSEPWGKFTIKAEKEAQMAAAA